MFFVKNPIWHDTHKIGSDFLCQGQLYNHIPGNTNLNFKDTIANSFRKLKDHYKDRSHCFDPWKAHPYTLDLSDKSQCLEFLNHLQDGNPNE